MINSRVIRMLAICLMGAASACKQSNNPASSRSTTSGTTPVQIVSLSPAISRALVDFHLQDSVVGRTPFCASLDQSVPDVGDLLNINYEAVIRLQPTHILLQPPEAGVDSHLQNLARQHHWKLVPFRLNTLDDIETMVREIPGALFADGSSEMTAAAQRSAELLNQIANALSPGEKNIYPGRVMLVYSLSPISVFGDETYLDGVLKAMGGANATSAKGWASFSAEDFVRLNPQAVVLIRPGLESTSVPTHFGTIWEMDIEAMNERRLGILKHPDSFLPSTSVIQVAAELRAILERFQAERP